MREEGENHRFAFDFFSGFVKLTDDALVAEVDAVEGAGGDYCGLIGDVLADVVVDFQGGKDRIIRRQGDRFIRRQGDRLAGGRETGYQEAGEQDGQEAGRFRSSVKNGRLAEVDKFCSNYQQRGDY